MRIDTPPYYIAATGNVITSTYGGLTANADMAVLDLFGEPIAGLFAAGELVGGFHGASYLSARDRHDTRRLRTTGVVSQSYLPCADAFERPRHRLAAILSFLKPPVSR
jgi:hypothetical protein